MIGMHMPVLRLNNWKRRYLRQIEAQKISIMYTEKKCMKKFCEFLREHAMKIINFKEKKMKILFEIFER